MSDTLTYKSLKTANQAREAVSLNKHALILKIKFKKIFFFLKEELKTETRKKNLIILILHWLTEEGYAETARSFERETNLDLRKYDVCDNIDLETILQEYESYYYVRFNRYPKVTKKITNSSKIKIFKNILFKIKNKKKLIKLDISTKIAKTASMNSHRKPLSSVPSLPNVNSNNTNGLIQNSSSSGFMRPGSVDVNNKQQHQYQSTNNLNKSNEFSKPNSNSTNQFNVDSNSNKKIKNFLPEKSVK